MQRIQACLIAIMLMGCADQDVAPVPSPSFNSFEISYSSGGTQQLSLLADTNKIFFAPFRWDSVHYGILPDSIVLIMNATVNELRNHPAMRSNKPNCDDCSAVALKIITRGDTIRIEQFGDLDKLFNLLIQKLGHFVDSGQHKSIFSILPLETTMSITELPPAIPPKK